MGIKIYQIHQIITSILNGKLGEVIRFGIVGVIATIIQYVFYYCFLYVGIGFGWAFTLSYGLSWLINFWLSAIFTFRKKASVTRGVGFAASHGFNYLIQMCCLKIFVWGGVLEVFAPIPVYAICIPINFLMVRFVFSKL